MQLFTNTFKVTPLLEKLSPKLKNYVSKPLQNVSILTKVLYKILYISPLKKYFKKLWQTFNIEKFPNNKFSWIVNDEQFATEIFVSLVKIWEIHVRESFCSSTSILWAITLVAASSWLLNSWEYEEYLINFSDTHSSSCETLSVVFSEH